MDEDGQAQYLIQNIPNTSSKKLLGEAITTSNKKLLGTRHLTSSYSASLQHCRRLLHCKLGLLEMSL